MFVSIRCEVSLLCATQTLSPVISERVIACIQFKGFIQHSAPFHLPLGILLLIWGISKHVYSGTQTLIIQLSGEIMVVRKEFSQRKNKDNRKSTTRFSHGGH